MSYYRPCTENKVEHVVKKSLFIGHLAVVKDIKQASAFIAEIKKQHPKANHNCHCYIAGSPEQSSLWAYSDDGEPKGCAGQPMFQVLKHSGLGNLCVVVTRYFGGIKLGTGGMARAYSACVNLALENIQTCEVHTIEHLSLTTPFAHTGNIEHIISALAGVYVIERQWYELGQKFNLAVEEPSVILLIDALSPFKHLIETSPSLSALETQYRQ